MCTIISGEEVKNAIKDLPLNKSTIPAKILKQYAKILLLKTDKYF